MLNVTQKKTKIEMPTPLPLHDETSIQASPYPIDALPQIIRDAILNYQKYGQQPIPLISCSALANISLACQSMANVARDNLLITPVSLYFLVIAASGERKSAADHAFGQAIRDWEKRAIDKLNPEVNQARALHNTWLAEKNAVLAQIRHAAIESYDTAWLKAKMLILMEQEPIIPLLPMLFFEDTTQEAITSHLANGWPSASLWSDEGGIVLAGHGMQSNVAKFIATLNRLWDGKAFITHRKTTKSFSVSNRRLTLSLMLQPLILQQLLDRNSGISRHSGFLARSLIAYPESSMGERYYQEPPTSLSALKIMSERLTECLDHSLTLDINGCEKIPTLHFSKEAKKSWVDFFNSIEKGLLTQWLDVKDFASKAAENVARLSALFHLFTGKDGSIQAETIEQATQVIEWHLLETKRLLHLSSGMTRIEQDATRLVEWLQNKKIIQTPQRRLQQLSPVRDKKRLDNAISHLVSTNHLKEIRQDRKSILVVNPAVLSK